MTNTSSAWRLVASREVDVKLRDKGFIISMIITVLRHGASTVGWPIISAKHDLECVGVPDD